MLKKTITTIALIGVLSTSAMADEINCEKETDQKVIKIMKDTYFDIQREETFELLGYDKTEDCSLLDIYKGKSICKQLDSYTKHIYKTYEKEQNINLLYSYIGITTIIDEASIKRANKDYMLMKQNGSYVIITPNKSKNDRANLLTSVIEYNISENKSLNAYNLLKSMSDINSSKLKKIVFYNGEFAHLLSYILEDDFEGADKVLIKFGSLKIKDQMCKD